VNDDKTGVILQWEKYEDGRSEKRKGNCYSAGQVMARIYQAMGYKATVRSAIHDKKSRYPSNMIMGSDHYNVEVIMNGRTYYLDATPGCGGVYLSSPKEVLESYIYGGNGWERIQ
jgi:arylamine N-acetyltransferase